MADTLDSGGHPERTLRVVLGVLGLTYLAVIAARPLGAPDEFRYAEIAREMLATGDWVLPRLNGVLYFEKPPLGYWLAALSLQVFGANAFAVRLPFALSSLASGVLVFALVRRFGPQGRWPYLSAAAFLSSAGVFAIGTIAVLDGLFAFWVSATLAAFFAATEAPPGSGRQRWLVASGAACGAAFLTKGFLAVAIPVVVAIPYLVLSGRRRDLLRLPWTPLAAALAVAAPWSIAVARADGDFWRYFVIQEHWHRFTGGAAAQHPEPFWFFVPVVLVGALPWTPLLLLLWRARPGSPLVRFALCWFFAPLLLLSASSGKLATYALPCAAPLFLWGTCAAATRDASALGRSLRSVARGIGGLASAAAVILLIPPTVLGLGTLPGLDPVRARVASAGVLLCLGLPSLLARRRRAVSACVGASAPVAMLIASFWFSAAPVHKVPGRWLATSAQSVPSNAIVVADRRLVHAVCWRLERADLWILGGPGELAYGLSRSRERDRVLDERKFGELLADTTRNRPVAVFARSDYLDRSTLPEPLRWEEGRMGTFALWEPRQRSARHRASRPSSASAIGPSHRVR